MLGSCMSLTLTYMHADIVLQTKSIDSWPPLIENGRKDNTFRMHDIVSLHLPLNSRICK